MGHETSKIDEGVDQSANYIEIRTEIIPPYGEVAILQHKEKKNLVVMRELISSTIRDFEREIAYFKIRYRIVHPNLLKLMGYHCKTEENMCSTAYKTTIILELIENTLENEIKRKVKTNDYYSEDRLWVLVGSILRGLLVLEKHTVFHGDVHPSKVFVSDRGDYKVLEHNMLSNGKTGYQKILLGIPGERSFLSPALIDNLILKELRPKHNHFKSDVFSAGLTILSAATLSNLDNAYNWEKISIDRNLISEKLSFVKEKYSQKFFEFLSDMLIEDEVSRPTFSELALKFAISQNTSDDAETYDSKLTVSPHHQRASKVSSGLRERTPSPSRSLLKASTTLGTDNRTPSPLSRSKTFSPNPNQQTDLTESRNLYRSGSLRQGFSPINASPKKVGFYEPNKDIEQIKQEFYSNLGTQGVSDRNKLSTSQEIRDRVYRSNSRSRSKSPSSPTKTLNEYRLERYNNGSYYEGEFKEGLRHGKGRFFYSDGGMYSGDWRAGEVDGYGILYYPSGKRAYEGMWKGNMFHGKGIMYNENPGKSLQSFDFNNFDGLGNDWVKYEGDFNLDKKSGNGLLYLANGDVFNGQFKDDFVDGVGTYYVQGEKTGIKAEWKTNRLMRKLYSY